MKNVMGVSLSHPAYNREVKLRNWNGRTTAIRCPCGKTAAQLIKRSWPSLSKEQHAEIAQYHASRAERLRVIWNMVTERAALQSFGRPWRFEDYKICAIGCEEFSEAHKRVLRHCAYRRSEHLHLAGAHRKLATRS